MDTWFWSDQHVGHDNVIGFLNKDGVTRLRPEFWSDDGSRKGFRDVRRMMQVMIDNFRRTVHNGDAVYFIGDVAWSERALLDFMSALRETHPRCEFFLALGNHDNCSSRATYERFFDEIEAEYEWKGEGDRFIATHRPLQGTQMGVHYGPAVNVHGHTHLRRLTRFGWLNDGTTPMNFGDAFDPRYYNVCVECTNYGLVHISQIRARVTQVLEEAGALCPSNEAAVAAVLGK